MDDDYVPSELAQLSNAVHDKASFIAFLDAFRADLIRELARPEEETRWGAGDWSHPTLEAFIETMGAWLTDTKSADYLDQAAWNGFATIFMAARTYE
jgi:hypothetical protein